MSVQRAGSVVVLRLGDASRIGFQLRMNLGGAYLDQLRVVVAMLLERDDLFDDSGQYDPDGAY